MRKTILYIVLAVLCPLFKANAQENKAIDVTAKGIQIGQQVPDITITNLHNYKDKDGKPAATAKLSDFKGKLLILDFWATWCSPCVAMIPKMDSLQKQFGDKVQFLSVTYQTEKEVLPFLVKYEKQQGRHYNLPGLTGDAALHKLFPHIYLPHYVWIDGSGTVKAITGYDQLTAENLESAIAGQHTNALKKKQDMSIAFNSAMPFLLNGNGGDGKNMIYHSLFTSYTEGIPSSITFKTLPNKGRHIMLSNVPVQILMQRAYSSFNDWYGPNRVFLELNNPDEVTSAAQGEEALNWLKTYGYCYELVLPPHLAANAGKIMQEEFKKLLPKYSAEITKRRLKCMVLVRTSKIDKIAHQGIEKKSKFTGFGCELKGVKLSALLLNLNAVYQQGSKLPLIDLTGYTNPVDISLTANLKDIASINKALADYDLRFEAQEADLNILVIRNRN